MRSVIVGDTHTNSIVGLYEPNFKLATGGSAPDTPWSKWIWSTWLNFCSIVNQQPISNVIWNGDIGDGFNELTKGQGSWSPDKQDWINSFLNMRKYLVKSGDVKEFGTFGSSYHRGRRSGVDTDAEMMIAIGANYSPHVDLVMDGFLFRIQHAVGSVSLVNPETALQKELRAYERLCREEYALHGSVLPYDGLVVNHIHLYAEIRKLGWIGIINGCWQGRTEYMESKSAFMLPHIGGTLIDVVPGYPVPIITYVPYRIPTQIWSTVDTNELLRIYERREKELALDKLSDGFPPNENEKNLTESTRLLPIAKPSSV